MTDSEFLISLAQNDYMIDGEYLPEGERLLVVSNELGFHEVVFRAILARVRGVYDDVNLGAMGPLGSDILEDVYRFAKEGLR